MIKTLELITLEKISLPYLYNIQDHQMILKSGYTVPLSTYNLRLNVIYVWKIWLTSVNNPEE